MAESHQKSEFYLISKIDNPALSPDRFGDIPAILDVRCVLIRSSDALDHDAASAKAVISNIQSQGIAVLVENEPAKAASLGADGVHLGKNENMSARVEEMQKLLSGDPITGIEVNNIRHDAMVLAEKGADYVAFDIEADNGLEIIEWWSELFEIPSVAWRVGNTTKARDCSAAGADFIALDLDVLEGAGGLSETLKQYQSEIDAVGIAA